MISCDVEVVDYVLKKNFDNYQKGGLLVQNLSDFLGEGIFGKIK